jgi:CxxC-x17-CxxC domain-containing protein
LYTDERLACTDCGNEFVFSAGEQEFFAAKGFQNKPNRCPDCRQARRATRGSGGMGGGGGSSYGRTGDTRQREMYSATCSQCGNTAQVPFQPRLDRPVYCSDCFQTQRPRGR